jgi:dTMP kinase
LKEGFFIVFEGPDGSGKSTQAEMLYNTLSDEGYRCIITQEPGGTHEGKKMREILLNPELKICPKSELFLFLADRAEHVERIIQPSLKEGKIVIGSRYFYSTLVYQGIARRIADLKFLEKMNLFAVGGQQPHIVFYLDVLPERGLPNAMNTPSSFQGGDRIEREGVHFQERVREGYMKLATQYRKIIVVIKNGPIEEIQKTVYTLTKRRLPV